MIHNIAIESGQTLFICEAPDKVSHVQSVHLEGEGKIVSVTVGKYIVHSSAGWCGMSRLEINQPIKVEIYNNSYRKINSRLIIDMIPVEEL